VKYFFTVVFSGNVQNLTTNPLFIDSAFGFPERITDGDVISEVEGLIYTRNQMLRVLRRCRKTLDDIPLSALGTADVDGTLAEIDKTIMEANKSRV